jgi:hypothetical protein
MASGVTYGRKPQWPGNSSMAPTDTGYDQHIATRVGRQGTYDQCNGKLNNNVNTWPLLITAVDIDLEVSGATAQSRLTRDFYPHNFVQPVFQISGQSIDNVDYAMMCEFIRESQYNLVNDFQINSLMQLHVFERGIPGRRTVGRSVTYNKQNAVNQTVRGPHKEILAQGVITSIPRQHQTGVFAPEWSFGFQVYSMIRGPFTEGPAIADTGNAATWLSLLNSGTNISTTPTTIAANKKIIKTTNSKSANVLSSSAGS